MKFKIGLASITLLLISACTSKAEQQFVIGCVETGGREDLCECTYEKLAEVYPKETFNKIEKGYVPSDFMEKMPQAVLLCRAED